MTVTNQCKFPVTWPQTPLFRLYQIWFDITPNLSGPWEVLLFYWFSYRFPESRVGDMSKYSCIRDVEELCPISVIVVSSTYLWMSLPETFKWSIITKKDREPSNDPWGIEPFRVSQEDISLAAWTLCCLQDKYEKSRCKRQWGIFCSNSFFNKILWFTLSKALLKSISNALTESYFK